MRNGGEGRRGEERGGEGREGQCRNHVMLTDMHIYTLMLNYHWVYPILQSHAVTVQDTTHTRKYKHKHI